MAILTCSGRVFLTEMVKRHIYGSGPFIRAYNQVSMTFRSNVLAHTSSSLEKLLFLAILATFTTSGRTLQLYRLPTFGLGLKMSNKWWANIDLKNPAFPNTIRFFLHSVWVVLTFLKFLNFWKFWTKRNADFLPRLVSCPRKDLV